MSDLDPNETNPELLWQEIKMLRAQNFCASEKMPWSAVALRDLQRAHDAEDLIKLMIKSGSHTLENDDYREGYQRFRAIMIKTLLPDHPEEANAVAKIVKIPQQEMDKLRW